MTRTEDDPRVLSVKSLFLNRLRNVCGGVLLKQYTPISPPKFRYFNIKATQPYLLAICIFSQLAQASLRKIGFSLRIIRLIYLKTILFYVLWKHLLLRGRSKTQISSSYIFYSKTRRNNNYYFIFYSILSGNEASLKCLHGWHRVSFFLRS